MTFIKLIQKSKFFFNFLSHKAAVVGWYIRLKEPLKKLPTVGK